MTRDEAQRMWCREHGMPHWTDMADPSCEFEDGFGDVVEVSS